MENKFKLFKWDERDGVLKFDFKYSRYYQAMQMVGGTKKRRTEWGKWLVDLLNLRAEVNDEN